MERNFFRSTLGQVHYVDAGPPAARSVVLLHQTPRSVDEYADVVPRLAERLRVLAIDTPGYGCSDLPESPPSVAKYAGVVVELLDHLGIERASLAGHHTGAIIAVEAAAAFPDRIERLVLSGPVYMDAETRQELGALFKQWYVREDGSHLIEKWERFAHWVEDPALVQRCLVDLLRAGETSEWGHFAIAEYHMEDRLPRVGAPTLLLFGLNDPFGYRDKNRVFLETVPECRAETIDGGVFLPSERPDAWARHALEFLDPA